MKTVLCFVEPSCTCVSFGFVNIRVHFPTSRSNCSIRVSISQSILLSQFDSANDHSADQKRAPFLRSKSRSTKLAKAAREMRGESAPPGGAADRHRQGRPPSHLSVHRRPIPYKFTRLFVSLIILISI